VSTDYPQAIRKRQNRFSLSDFGLNLKMIFICKICA
jgi:hypothetical protein